MTGKDDRWPQRESPKPDAPKRRAVFTSNIPPACCVPFLNPSFHCIDCVLAILCPFLGTERPDATGDLSTCGARSTLFALSMEKRHLLEYGRIVPIHD